MKKNLDFDSIVSLLRQNGVEVIVDEYKYIYPIKVATIKSSDIEGGFATGVNALLFTDEELLIIRELLSELACGYERTTFDWHCCDANEIIQKIDTYLQSKG